MSSETEAILTGIAVGALKLAWEEIKDIIKNRKKSKDKKRKSRNSKS